MTTKTFSLAQILTVTTGRLCCKMEGVYEILNHLAGDNLFTHVLPRAIRFGKPKIYSQWPEVGVAEACLSNLDKWLHDCKENNCPEEGVKMWLAELAMLFPNLKKEYPLESCESAWESLDPLQELEDMVGPEKVVVVEIPKDEP